MMKRSPADESRTADGGAARAMPAHGPVIVWELGDLLIGRMRRAFDRAGVRPIFVRSARECLQALRSAPAAAVIVEVRAETAADVLFGLWAMHSLYPRAIALAALQRGLEGSEPALREQGVVDLVRSPRRLESLAAVALRHASASGASERPIYGWRRCVTSPGWFASAE
ncbi:MAG TPA: hypothetical protein VGE52_06250 [Pirellulales bacterium]